LVNHTLTEIIQILAIVRGQQRKNASIILTRKYAMRRGSILISLPVIVGTTVFLAVQPPAYAVELAAEQATELLARSQALNEKCNFFNSVDRDELSGYAARAELALARRESVDITKQILARGRSAAKTTPCSETERAGISEILATAREAAAMAAAAPKPKAAAPVEKVQVAQVVMRPAPVTKSKPDKLRVLVNVEAEPPKKMLRKQVAGLNQYANITERYFTARRCGTMSARAISNFYQTVVASHKQVVSNFGRAAVADVMQQSESKANARSCG
jgi:hypothetical protein